MKKQSKAKTKAEANGKPETGKPDAAKAKTDKAGKRTGGACPFPVSEEDGKTLDILMRGLGVSTPEEVELLREIANGIKTIADRVESVRRTLWRMSEIREYENKGAKGKPEKGGKPDAGAADRKPDAGKPKANRKPEKAKGGEK